ncbi:MAG: hypothetical protein EOO40_06145 [Deltaproteobacteria bacterium]|nr:MAG: hypothetical protein EOO40_06145 [Deltaproteobacteria bacterium]
MFVEGEVEVRLKDRAALAQDDHDLKLWLQRAFRDMSCYRISSFRKDADKVVHAVVALKIADLPQAERLQLEAHPQDAALLRQFIERMFVGKGSCRALGEPQLRSI